LQGNVTGVRFQSASSSGFRAKSSAYPAAVDGPRGCHLEKIPYTRENSVKTDMPAYRHRYLAAYFKKYWKQVPLNMAFNGGSMDIAFTKAPHCSTRSIDAPFVKP